MSFVVFTKFDHSTVAKSVIKDMVPYCDLRNNTCYGIIGFKIKINVRVCSMDCSCVFTFQYISVWKKIIFYRHSIIFLQVNELRLYEV